MIGLAIPDLTALTPRIIEFFLVATRLSFILILLPGIGDQVVPTRIRVFLLVGLSVMFVMSGAVTVSEAPPLTTLIGWIGLEALIGASLGIGLRASIWVLTIAGSVIAQSIGLAQFLGVTVEHEASTIVANILSMAGITLLLSADYHLVVIASAFALYSDMPAGAQWLDVQASALAHFHNGFNFAIMLAWPFVVVNLLYNVCLGFINKALPQMMVAFVGAPFMVGAGVVFLAISIMSLLMVWLDRVPVFLDLL